jgi:hypothetical protein
MHCLKQESVFPIEQANNLKSGCHIPSLKHNKRIALKEA